MGTGTKIALLISGIAVVGVGTYFIMKSVKKAKEKKEAEKNVAEQKVVSDGFSDMKNPLRLIPNTQPLGFGAQKGGLSNISLYDRDAFKKSLSDITNQLPKKYDPNFLLNRKPFTYKPISTI